MKHLLILSALLAPTVLAHAAPTQTPLATTTSKAQGGVFPLPDGVDRLVGLDATNTIVAQMRPEVGEERQFRVLQVKHVYVGGIVALFGGSVIPTAPFVSPGFSQGGGFNGAQGGAQNGGNFSPIGGLNQSQQGTGFMFPQSGFNNGFNQTGNVAAQSTQPGLTLGTPVGNFFLPSKRN